MSYTCVTRHDTNGGLETPRSRAALAIRALTPWHSDNTDDQGTLVSKLSARKP